MDSKIKNMDLQIAGFAHDCVREVLDLGRADLEKKYKTLSKKMPMLIRKNGLIGLIAFCCSKKSKEHLLILKHISEWCDQSPRLYEIQGKWDFTRACEKDCRIKDMSQIDSTSYRLLSREVMILFDWLKRVSDAMIEGESDE